VTWGSSKASFRPEYEKQWVPVKRIADGEKALANLKSLAGSKQPFDCFDSACSMMLLIPATRPESGAGSGPILARCAITKIGNAMSFPRACFPIAFQNAGEYWMLTFSSMEPQQPPPPPSPPRLEVITLRAKDGTVVDDGRLIERAGTALKNPPLTLDPVQNQGPSALVAFSASQYTNLVPGDGGWYIRPEIHVTANSLKLYLTCNLEINKYNTNDERDWRSPTADQQTVYCAAVSRSITKELEGLCSSSTLIGTDTIQCK
jgi:hypothetical protein